MIVLIPLVCSLMSFYVIVIGESTPIDILNLTMAVFSEATANTMSYDIAFPLFQDTDIIASELCSTYLKYEGDRFTKCIIGLDQTVRNGKVQRLHKVIEPFFKTPFNDAELFPLTYVYDFPSYLPITVCIFGYPEYSSLLLALLTMQVREVHVYAQLIDRFVLSVPLSDAYQIAAEFKTKLFLHFGDTLEDRLLLVSHRCDVHSSHCKQCKRIGISADREDNFQAFSYSFR